MDSIDNWFKGTTDYHVGVAIYASLPVKNPRTLKRLNRGKTNANMATLVAELRRFRSVRKPQKKKTVPSIAAPVPKVPEQQAISTEMQRKQLAHESGKREFGCVLLGDLPERLRPRLILAQKTFYQMIELKFALNDLPAAAEKESLAIQVQISKLDEERDLIWKELRHWKRHRT
ncbi:MAG: hypothetical protein WBG90_05035, partial [Saonia sp.]